MKKPSLLEQVINDLELTFTPIVEDRDEYGFSNYRPEVSDNAICPKCNATFTISGMARDQDQHNCPKCRESVTVRDARHIFDRHSSR